MTKLKTERRFRWFQWGAVLVFVYVSDFLLRSVDGGKGRLYLDSHLWLLLLLPATLFFILFLYHYYQQYKQ